MATKTDNGAKADKGEKACYAKLQKKLNIIGIVLAITFVMSFFSTAVLLVEGQSFSNNSSDINRLQSDVAGLQDQINENNVKANGVSYEGQNDKTALELLKDSHRVETKDYSGMGEFVTSIDDVAAEDGKNFWAFYIDGQLAAEGASTYKTKDGEKIEWRLDAVQ